MGSPLDRPPKLTAHDLKLSEHIHDQVRQYIREAEASDDPEIRRVALEIARNTAKNLWNQSAKMSPAQVITWAAVVLFIALGISIIALLNCAAPLSGEITLTSFGFAIILIGVILLVAGYFTQENFNKLVETVGGWFKKSNSSNS